MGLLLKDQLDVSTSHGTCQIQLCVGSVTKLQEPVDVLIISAFPGDYTPTFTSVIGALHRDLNVSIRALSKDKEEDLRSQFSCWWSKPFPSELKLPMKRILCFEGSFKQQSNPSTTIAEVFRSLIALCKNQDIKVVMPLLATGDQSYSKDLMMELLLDASIHWMQVGLPLKLLKVVLFTQNVNKLDAATLELCTFFAVQKEKWLSKWKINVPCMPGLDYDIYLSHSDEDQHLADRIVDMLDKLKNGIRIYKFHQTLNKEKSWQEEIYKVMVKCSRVLALLSPNYLQDTSCIEQYNIALCCSRNMNHDYLAPLYVSEISCLPTYMSLIQYFDCRPSDVEKIKNACRTVFVSIMKKSTQFDKTNHITSSFDVFVSYAHKDCRILSEIVCLIKKQRPSWNVFVDQSGLQAGTAWQTKLYSSIENSKYVIALLSSNYFGSKVCQEEYNLAKALNDDPNYSTRLVPISIENVGIWPPWCASPTYRVMENKLSTKMTQIIERMEFVDSTNSLSVLPIKEITSMWRQEYASQNFPIAPGNNFLKHLSVFETESMLDMECHVFLSYHLNDSLFAEKLKFELVKYLPKVQISLPVSGMLRLELIDKAKIIVPLLSHHYIGSSELMEEYNIALCRHRSSVNLVFCPIIVGKLPLRPAYPHISFALFSIDDEIWQKDNDPIVYCLETAAILIGNILLASPQVDCSFKTLYSMTELEEWRKHFHRNETADSSPNFNPLVYRSLLKEHKIEILRKFNLNENPYKTKEDFSMRAIEKEDLSFYKSLPQSAYLPTKAALTVKNVGRMLISEDVDIGECLVDLNEKNSTLCQNINDPRKQLPDAHMEDKFSNDVIPRDYNDLLNKSLVFNDEDLLHIGVPTQESNDITDYKNDSTEVFKSLPKVNIVFNDGNSCKRKKPTSRACTLQ